MRACIVVPCYNEAKRLDRAAFERCVDEQDDVQLLLVDDGSRDETLSLLRDLEASRPGRIEVLPLSPNAGKAEAVRRGMLHALGSGTPYAGYWDADLATPFGSVPDFVEILETKPEVRMVFGSRVRLLGRHIERKALRHYLGRVFATAASLLLRLPVYDTQCGAKLFRNEASVRALFADPFATNWIFDVEIISRWIAASRNGELAPAHRVIVELPLMEWRDIGGSKVKPSDYVRALREFRLIWSRYFRK